MLNNTYEKTPIDITSFCDQLDTTCLERLYKNSTASSLFKDTLLAGIPEKSVPIDIDRDIYMKRAIDELKKRGLIPALFVLAALTWPEDIELRLKLSLIASILKTPAEAIPLAWPGMRSVNKKRLEQLWKELSPEVPEPSTADENNKKLMQDQLEENAPKLPGLPNYNENKNKKKLTFQELIKTGIFDKIVEDFKDESLYKPLLKRINFPDGEYPNFGKCDGIRDFWYKLCEKIEKGKVKGGYEELLNAASEEYPYNEFFMKFKKSKDETETFINKGTTDAYGI